MEARRSEAQFVLTVRGATARLLVLSVRNASSSPETKNELSNFSTSFIPSRDYLNLIPDEAYCKNILSKNGGVPNNSKQ